MRKVVLSIFVIVLICAVAEISTRTHWLDPVENIYYDLWHRIAGLRVQPKHVAIVAIDDVTLLEHKDEPLAFWSPHFAKAIEVLRKTDVSVIGLDLLFSVSAEAWLKKLNLPGNNMSRTYDISMRAQLAQGKVVLAGLLAFNERGEGEYLLPLDDYVIVLPDQLASVGLTNMFSDADGVVRNFIPALFEDDRLPSLTFATLLAVKAEGLDPKSTGWSFGGSEIANTQTPRCIGFVGPPKSIPRLSFSRLLSPHADNDSEIQRLKNKVVIIATHHTGMQDLHLTPYSRTFLGWEGEMMSGSELHANIVETLLTDRFPRPISPWLRVLYLAAVLSLATFLFFRGSPWKGIGIGLLIGVMCATLAYFLFYYHRILPVANVQIALVVGYLATLGFRLTGEERERVRLRQIFGRFVSDEVVDHLVTTGTNPDLGGESLQITVLFSDIRNFTTISEKLAPHEVVEMLNTYFS